jgi:3-phosphoglycerate kinase
VVGHGDWVGEVVNPEGLKALAEHWPLMVLVAAALVVVGGLIGVTLRTAFTLFFWNEVRFEKLIQKALDMLMASKVFAEAVERISMAFTSKVEEQITDLRKRDEERAQSVGRAHARIDDLATRTNEQLLDLAKRLPWEGPRG